MKLAIHHRDNSFSDRWITYCKDNNITYIIVDCFSTTIIETLLSEKITHLMWHFHHASTNDIVVSNYVLNSIEKTDVKVFPNWNTRWHFDDKVAQKYLMEVLELPFAKSYVFYDKEVAKKHIKTFNFPIVSKLKRGAGSTNVKLLYSIEEAYNQVNLMFEKGIQAVGSSLSNLDQKFRVARKIKNPLQLFKKVLNHIKKTKQENNLGNIEKGYVYFQDFMAKNDFDTRIIVVGNKAFGIRRFNKANDFRASGSGKIYYKHTEIDIQFVTLAFEATTKIGAQCLAFDFVYDENKKPSIIEICYAFSMYAYDECEGFWDDTLSFHEGKFNPQYFMIANLLNE